MKYINNFIFIIIVIIVMAFIANNNIKNDSEKLTEDNYVYSSEFRTVLGNALTKYNDDTIFKITTGTRSQYIIINLYSQNKLSYNDYCVQAKKLVDNVYEELKDITIKKDGLLSIDNFILNFQFYEQFRYAITNTYNYKQVGLYQIHIEDLEKYRDYDQCVNGGISELEWQQEK